MKTPQEKIEENKFKSLSIELTNEDLVQLKDFEKFTEYYNGTPIKVKDTRFNENVINYVNTFGWLIQIEVSQEDYNKPLKVSSIITH